MAMADTATLLWAKFLDSLYGEDAKQFLSSLISREFESIACSTDMHMLMDLNGLPTELFSGGEAAAFRRTLCRVLCDLNKELAECIINGQRKWRQQRKALSMNLYFYPLTELYSVRRLQMQLAGIRGRISDARNGHASSTPPHSLEPYAADPELTRRSPLISFGNYAPKTDIEERILGERFLQDGVGLSMIGICGMAGSGKTTLVRKIFDGERVSREFSKRRVWLSFSNGAAGIDPDRIVKDALKALHFDVDGLCDDITPSLAALLGILNSELSGERYLIVLDNISVVDGFLKDLGKKSSTSEEEGRDRNKGHLSQGLPKGCGGVVVVISRLVEVAREIVGEQYLVHLLPFDDSNCWTIFKDAVEEERLITIKHPTLENIDDEIKHQCHGLPLAAKLLAKIIPRQIFVTEFSQILKDFYIPDYIFSVDSAVKAAKNMPKCPCPVFVFVDTSMEQLKREFLIQFHSLLNQNQVFDLKEKNPGDELHRVYLSLENLKRDDDDALASHILENLRIIVIGGDDTINQLLAAICDLKLPWSPPVASIPLESNNNNIGLSLGWGRKNPEPDRNSVESILTQVRQARVMKIDSWHILLKMKDSKDSCEPSVPLQLPQFMHEFQCGFTGNELGQEKHPYHFFHGGLWSHFSMGMDAQVLYAACNKDLLHDQMVNRDVRVRCTQGWFCASICQPSSPDIAQLEDIAQLVKVKIMKKRSGQWQDLSIPHRFRSIICLNLPCFSGGTSPWGTTSSKKLHDRGSTPFVDDGLLEVVGFRDAWHGLPLKRYGTCLAQARRIRFEFHKSAPKYICMSLDGTPWKQPLPIEDDTVVIELSHIGQVNMLATSDCPSRSVQDRPFSLWNRADNATESDEDDYLCGKERKFGAAATFKIPGKADVL